MIYDCPLLPFSMAKQVMEIKRSFMLYLNRMKGYVITLYNSDGCLYCVYFVIILPISV